MPREAGSGRRVVLLASRGTLAGLGPAVRARGLRLRRVDALRIETVRAVGAPTGRPPSIDTLVVTSRHAVGPSLRRWVGSPSTAGALDVWAGGPGTVERLRRFGFHRVRRGTGLGASGIVRQLDGRRRSIVHIRSDVAGDGLARALRAQGHHVTEVVAYRVRPNVREIRRRLVELRHAAVVVFASPSAVSGLRAALGRERARALGRAVPAVVLGERTARAATAAGFRSVDIARTSLPQRLAGRVARVALDGRA